MVIGINVRHQYYMQEKLNFLKRLIDERINSINSGRLYYRKQSFIIFIGTAILSAVVTILLGSNVEPPSWKEAVRITALVITTIITLINGYNAFFNHKDLWIAHNETRNRLFQLKFDIEFYEAGNANLDEATIARFKKTYQEILDDLNQSWYKSRSEAQTK